MRQGARITGIRDAATTCVAITRALLAWGATVDKCRRTGLLD